LKNILSAALILATLSAPVAALASDESSASASASQAQPAASVPAPAKRTITEATSVLSRPAPDKNAGLWVPKYLTIQQQNDAHQAELDELFGVHRSP
jgi:hypothetical protein